MRFPVTFATVILSLVSSVVVARPTHGHGTPTELHETPAAAPVPYTNAQRFARGLPPITPARGRGGTLRPRTSPGVCAGGSHRGKIKIISSKGTHYLRRDTSNGMWFGATNSVAKALEVNLEYDGNSAPSYFRIRNPTSFLAGSIYPYLAAGMYYETGNQQLGPNSGSAVGIVGTNENTSATSPAPAIPGRPSTNDPNKYYYQESLVWSIGADNILTLSWVNPSGGAPIALPAYLALKSGVAGIGDATHFLVWTGDVNLATSRSFWSSNTFVPATVIFECL
ncbi:hypothetical protein FRC02_002330 [Tulasnella sp. 418]|nr:hypothetical protein FRC02_002330 [Tulasnella sp. 418]